ncbi:25344_t:CDS:1 [Dentiscutata erythropus]|uniref:25344_t:CDS:1 n=1 Tax=Dentiscutata erythropus TaxID=1348616 RepID=A0A9N8WIW8_9GLOM|nr:25344_t:CDS:1 [Dentiscutata erythropus]
MEDITHLTKIEVITSTWFLAASFALTADSFSHAVVKLAINKWNFLLFTVNVAIIVNEIFMLFQVVASSNCSNINSSDNCNISNAVSFSRCTDHSSVRMYYMIEIIKFFGYLIAKPGMLHLAYLRCSSVFKPFKKPAVIRFHYSIMAVRVLEIAILATTSITDLIKCQGSYCEPECSYIPTISFAREAAVPIFVIYYIIAEFIFYMKLFKVIREIYNDGNTQRDLYHQAALFTIDILQLSAMCVYRLVGLVVNLPTYRYAEVFSIAFTIFVMTKFWHMIPILTRSIGGSCDDTDIDKVNNIEN